MNYSSAHSPVLTCDMLITLRPDSGPAEGDSPSGRPPGQGDTGGARREMEGGLPQSGRTFRNIHIENDVKSFPNLQVDLDHLLLDGGWKRGEVDWLRFVGLSTLTISEGIGPSLATACEVLSDDPDGISANIKLEVFKEIYTYLSERCDF